MRLLKNEVEPLKETVTDGWEQKFPPNNTITRKKTLDKTLDKSKTRNTPKKPSKRNKTLKKSADRVNKNIKINKMNNKIIEKFKNMVDELMDLFQECKYQCINKFPNDQKYKEQIKDFIEKKPMIEWKRSCEGYIPICRKLTLKDEQIKEFMVKYQNEPVYNELSNIYNVHVVQIFSK
jgi:hypothetical protein